MLLKKNRLTQEKQIKKVLQSGKPFLTKFFNFKVIKNDLPETRFCIIISKKVSKLATKRNRIKRQVSEVIRLNLPNIKTGFDMVIFCKNDLVDRQKNSITIDYQEMEKNIIWALTQQRIIIIT
jgi:ribonuclease P protein component